MNPDIIIIHSQSHKPTPYVHVKNQ